MSEAHSHAESAARRLKVDVDQERLDTELADKWVAENGGWVGAISDPGSEED